VNVTGLAGERIGTVERFEIDRSGQLKALVVRVASSLGALGMRKRIAAHQIRGLRNGTIHVAVSAAEVGSLADAPDATRDGLWPEDLSQDQAVQ
jgi:hypothetical protein